MKDCVPVVPPSSFQKALVTQLVSMQILQTNQCTGLPQSQSKVADHPVQHAGVVGSAVTSKDAEVAAVTGGDADQLFDLIDGLSKHRREVGITSGFRQY